MNENKEYILIGLAGDVMIGRLVDRYLTQINAPSSYIWGDLLPFLQSTDLNLVNLETVLTTSHKKAYKKFHFKATPDKVQSLVAGSIHVVNLANNHILDYLKEGFFETLDTLKKFNIGYVGAGKNLFEARLPIISMCKGIKIGILGCTDNEPTWLAKDCCPGIHYISVENAQTIKQDVDQLRNQVDFLIVSIHWGPNMKERPSESFIEFAHHLIDRGVDIIHGHSAHLFQGVEIYKEKVILYDTGDFINDYSINPQRFYHCSFLFIVELNCQGLCSLRLIPTRISNFQINKAQGKEAEESMNRMLQLSANFNTFFNIRQGELWKVLK